MDSVIGRVGGKCLLTIHFVESSLMLAFCGTQYISLCNRDHKLIG